MFTTKLIRICLAIVFLLIAFILEACSSPTEPEYGILRITVLDETSLPVAGVEVVLLALEESDATSVNGTVTFSDVPKGTQAFQIQGPAILSCYGTVHVTARDTTDHTAQVMRGRGFLKIHVLDAFNEEPLQGISVVVTRDLDGEIIFEGLTNELGLVDSPALPTMDVTVTAGGQYPLIGASISTEVRHDMRRNLRIYMTRSISEFSGELRFSCEANAPTGNAVGILYALEEGGTFQYALEPVFFPYQFSVSTAQHGFLSVVALGNQNPYEFLLSASPVYDCRENHTKADLLPLVGWISHASPRGFPQYPQSKDELRLKCIRDGRHVIYTEWQVFRWTQDGSGNWQYQLVWYSGGYGPLYFIDWELETTGGGRVPATSEGTPYSWILIDLYEDERSRVTQDYFIILVTGLPAQARTSVQVGTALKHAAFESLSVRASRVLWRTGNIR